MNYWEVCPLCKGDGIFQYKECPVCKGKRIINFITGLPPVNQEDKINYNKPYDVEEKKKTSEKETKEESNKTETTGKKIPFEEIFKNPYIDKTNPVIFEHFEPTCSTLLDTVLDVLKQVEEENKNKKY